jgi:hypothetical protein
MMNSLGMIHVPQMAASSHATYQPLNLEEASAADNTMH